ncbi:MAG: phage capsid protein [Bacteroidota bacterium]
MAAELLKRQFLSELSENLFPKNEFYRKSKNDSQFVNADSVQLPHAGTVPNVELDRTTKADSAKRADTPTEYKLHELSTDPTWLQYSEELTVAYNKRSSILYNHRMQLQTAAANFIAAAWGGTQNVKTVRTTGENRAVSGVPSGTGTRKRFVLADLQTGVKLLNEDDVPLEGRFAVITPAMLDDMLQIKEVQSSDFNKIKPLVEGSIGRYMGVDFYVRSKVNIFTAGATIRPYASTTEAATDCAGGILWHKDMVRHAFGSIKSFLELDQPNIYGSEFSALARVGALGARADGKGIINLVEDPGA